MNKKLIVIGVGIVSALFLWLGTSLYPNWLWFENLGFSPVFWTMLLGKFGFGVMVWLFLALIVGANIYAANRLNPPGGPGGGFKVADDYFSQFGLSMGTLKTLLTAFCSVSDRFYCFKRLHAMGFALALSVSAAVWQQRSDF